MAGFSFGAFSCAECPNAGESSEAIAGGTASGDLIFLLKAV